MALDPEQLALASVAEQARAVANEAKWRAREVARVTREAALVGNAAAALARRAALLPLLSQDVELEPPVLEGVVVND